MNKLIKTFAVLWMVGLCACTVKEPSVNAPAAENQWMLGDDICSGELFVCFDARVSEIIENAGLTKSGIGAPATRSGIRSVDEVLDLVDGYEIERVFPVDKRTEQTARKEGLHLWYIVRFGEEHSVREVAENLSQLGEVSYVGFNRTIQRATEETPIHLTADLLRNLKLSSCLGDPLYDLQWNLKNDGSLDGYLTNEPGTPAKFLPGADVNAEEAWAKTTGHPSIVVAVLDEGIDINHPDLAASMWVNEDEVYGSVTDNDGNGYAGDRHGYNFVKKTGHITTNDRYDSGHGSHVAGAIAARNDNGIGIRSIAGGNGSEDSGVRLMSCQIFSGAYAATLLDEVRAIKYAADNGAVVLQCSWGYVSGAANPYEWTPQFVDDDQWMTYNPLEKRALDYFVQNAGSPDGVIDGGIVVYASGNEAAPASAYPGAYKDYVSVAAIAGDFTPAVYTNYGMGTTIAAPGGDQDYYYDFAPVDSDGRFIYKDMGAIGCILSTLPEWVTDSLVTNLPGEFKGYGYMEGTSMACPQVSAVVALGLSYALEQRKHFKAQEFIDLLYKSCRPFEDAVFVSEKKWYKYIVQMGLNHPMLTPLSNYKGKMGAGLVDAAALLNAIDGVDAPRISFPNVTLSVGESGQWCPTDYFAAPGPYTVAVADQTIATLVYDATKNKVKITAKAVGQTKATISTADETQHFVISVRKKVNDNGWL